MTVSSRCVACQRPIDDVRQLTVCRTCRGAYHRSCWDDLGGCVRPDCHSLLRRGHESLAYWWRRVRAWGRNVRAKNPLDIPVYFWVVLLVLLVAALVTIFVPSLHFMQNQAGDIMQQNRP
ncbi:MAG TPA: RING finger protein [bacterium]|nr:RING finger protein [bacterium]